MSPQGLDIQPVLGDCADNALEWIWEVDENGRYTYASAAVENILGYTPEEVLWRHFYDFLPPDVREESRAVALEALTRKEPFRRFENQRLHKNGERVWISTTGVPVFDDRGNILGYRGAAIDVSDRKRAEEVLRESEARYRLLADNATDLIWVEGPEPESHLSEPVDRTTAGLQRRRGHGADTRAVHDAGVGRVGQGDAGRGAGDRGQ